MITKRKLLLKTCAELAKSTHAVSFRLEATRGRNEKIVKLASASQEDKRKTIKLGASTQCPFPKTVTQIENIVCSRCSAILTHFALLLSKASSSVTEAQLA